MLELRVKIREKLGRKNEKLRKMGIIPAVLYGSKIKNLSLSVDLKEFEEMYKKVGKSSLVSIQVVSPDKSLKKYSVLVHKVQNDPLTEKLIHIDFYQPVLGKEVEVSVPLVFEGESAAVKDLNGTLVKKLREVIVKSLPENLPHEIKVNIGALKTFQDEILIKDIKLPDKVKAQQEPDEIVAKAISPEKIEKEELGKSGEGETEGKTEGEKTEKRE